MGHFHRRLFVHLVGAGEHGQPVAESAIAVMIRGIASPCPKAREHAHNC